MQQRARIDVDIGVNGMRRRPVMFRCSDEAYERLFRRQDGRDGDETNQGRRLDEVLTKFLDEVEAEHGIRLLQPASEREAEAQLVVRRLLVDADVKKRFDALAKGAPVSKQMLFTEAIWRFTRAR